METAGHTKCFIIICQITVCHIPEDHNIKRKLLENSLKERGGIEKEGVGVARGTTLGGQETMCPVLKVPRQCSIVLLVEVRHISGNSFLCMALEGLLCSEVRSNVGSAT
jgi:hypothetical protein